MIDDFDYEDFMPLYPGHEPRAFHFFRVTFVVTNKLTGEYNRCNFYVCAKRSATWLSRLLSGRWFYRLPSDYFTYSWSFKEVEDDPNVTFHHITTKESWELVSYQYVMYTVVSHKWKIDYRRKIRKFFKKIVTLLVQIFKNKGTVVTYG